MNIYRFLIRPNERITDAINPGLEWSGCDASALASTEQEARDIIERYAAENGYDARWIRVARVIVLPGDRPTKISFTMF